MSCGRRDLPELELFQRLTRGCAAVSALLVLTLTSGQDRVTWDGKDDVGQGVSSGPYLLLGSDGRVTARAKVVEFR